MTQSASHGADDTTANGGESRPLGIGDHLFGVRDDDDKVLLVGFLDALKSAGLVIGTRERTSVSAVTSVYLTSGGPPLRLEDLAPRLAPLLARTPEERDVFFRTVAALSSSWSDAIEQSINPDASEQPSVEETPQKNWPWLQVAIVSLFALAAASASVFLIINRPPTETTIGGEVIGTTEERTAGRSGSPGSVQPGAPASLDGLARVGAAASMFNGAPSLEELGAELARRSPIGWTQEAYVERLQELSGLPRDKPLLLRRATVVEDEATPSLLARLAYLVDLIERPGRGGAPRDYWTASNALSPMPVWVVAEMLAGSLDFIPGTKSEAVAAAFGLVEAELAAQNYSWRERPRVEAIIERALSAMPGTRTDQWANTPWEAYAPSAATTYAPAWAAWVAAAVPVGVLLVWFAMAANRRKAYLRRRRPEFPPLHMNLLAETSQHAVGEQQRFLNAARRLGRRTTQKTQRLDVERTISATIGGGGQLIAPVFGHSRAMPEYLILIERKAGDDHDYHRLLWLARQLSAFIHTDIYSYQLEPSLVESVGGGAAEPIERIYSRHPEHRLLVLGSGDGFLDLSTRKPVPGADRLTLWDRRALLTPIPLADWAQEELTLARELDMPIGRATVEGLEILAEMLGLEGAEANVQLRSDGDGRARPMPDGLKSRQWDLLDSYAPETGVDQVVQDLRNYLDAPGFDWLCALCVYPAVQWDLTLYLGLTLKERAGSDKPLFAEQRLASLTSLPWLRHGMFPGWLRRTLIAALPRHRALEVRHAIGRLLREAMPRDSEDETREIRFQLSLEAPKEALAPEDLFDDEVFVDFLSSGDLEDFEVRRDDLSNAEAERPRIRFDAVLAVVLCGIFTVCAFVLTPKPGDGALWTGAWVPLVVLGIGAAISLAAAFPGACYRTVLAAAEYAVPLAPLFLVAFGVVAASAVIVPQFPAMLGLEALVVASILHPFAHVVSRRVGLLVVAPEASLAYGARVMADALGVSILVLGAWSLASGGGGV